MLWVVGCSYEGMPEVRTPVRNVFGGCCLLRRDLFDLVGGFDPVLGRQLSGAGGGEEADFCLRVATALPGAVFVHEPSAVIWHRVPVSRARTKYFLRRCFDEGYGKARVLRSSSLDGLNSETSFVARALTKGLIRHLGHPGDGGLGRAFLLFAGILAASLGLARGLVRPAASPRTKHSALQNVLQPWEGADE
jgi:hypothetical protein